MRRSIPTLLLVSAAIALTACGEYSTTEPLSGAKNAGLAPSFAGYAVTGDCDPSVDPTCVATANASLVPGATNAGQTVTFYAKGGTIHFGGLFTLVYRQNSVSICNSQGTSCSALNGSVTATATYGLNAKGAPYLDIELPDASQHLYFATPGAKLSTSFYANNAQSILGSGKPLGLLYAPTLGSPSEPNAPKSHFDAAGNLWRWITHFSGYAVTGDCTDPNDPSCAQPPEM